MHLSGALGTALHCTATAGWTDPILAQAAGGPDKPAAKMSLGIAFENITSPETIFKMNLTDLSYSMSPLIFRRNVTAGRDKGGMPQQACRLAAQSPKTLKSPVLAVRDMH